VALPRGSRQALTMLVILATALALWWFLRDERGGTQVLRASPEPAAAIPASSSTDEMPEKTPDEAAGSSSNDGAAAGREPSAPPANAGNTSAVTASPSLAGADADPGLAALDPSDARKPAKSRELPRHWTPCFSAAGPNNIEYELFSDATVAHGGRSSAAIRSLAPRPQPASAGLCQFIAADKYRGKRVEFAAMLRTQAVVPGAHLMVRADARDGRVLAFDVMRGAWIPGTNDWLRQSIVIDIPEQAVAIMLGVGLVNVGAVWIDDATLAIVDATWPLTQRGAPPTHYSLAPDPGRLGPDLRNAGFEETRPAPAR
jgi:hypothetical protein